MITGLNHITLAVADLSRSVTFYQDLLGCRLVSLRATDAYFDIGGVWFCLSVDPAASRAERADYTHIAFDLAPEEFKGFVAKLESGGVVIWKDNRSEGDSVYFLDPDGHKLEAHVGTLASRLDSFKSTENQIVTGAGCVS